MEIVYFSQTTEWHSIILEKPREHLKQGLGTKGEGHTKWTWREHLGQALKPPEEKSETQDIL